LCEYPIPTLTRKVIAQRTVVKVISLPIGNELASYHYGSDEPENVINSLASLYTEGSTSAVEASRSLQFLSELPTHTPY
jgi:hypothetical protein